MSNISNCLINCIVLPIGKVEMLYSFCEPNDMFLADVPLPVLFVSKNTLRLQVITSLSSPWYLVLN